MLGENHGLAAVGTGGTITGVYEVIKGRKASFQAVAVAAVVALPVVSKADPSKDLSAQWWQWHWHSGRQACRGAAGAGGDRCAAPACADASAGKKAPEGSLRSHLATADLLA